MSRLAEQPLTRTRHGLGHPWALARHHLRLDVHRLVPVPRHLVRLRVSVSVSVRARARARVGARRIRARRIRARVRARVSARVRVKP